jgi:hypothetical protein
MVQYTSWSYKRLCSEWDQLYIPTAANMNMRDNLVFCDDKECRVVSAGPRCQHWLDQCLEYTLDSW